MSFTEITLKHIINMLFDLILIGQIFINLMGPARTTKLRKKHLPRTYIYWHIIPTRMANFYYWIYFEHFLKRKIFRCYIQKGLDWRNSDNNFLVVNRISVPPLHVHCSQMICYSNYTFHTKFYLNLLGFVYNNTSVNKWIWFESTPIKFKNWILTKLYLSLLPLLYTRTCIYFSNDIYWIIFTWKNFENIFTHILWHCNKTLINYFSF